MNATPPDLPQSTIERAVSELSLGHLVAIPTETVYGLAADATNEQAISQVFVLKGRPPDRPLIVHLAAAEQLSEWALDIPEYARVWADEFWPGPLTLVLPKKAHVSTTLTAGQSTVACRVPNHLIALATLTSFGGGLVAPSANRYGHISPTTAEAVHEEFGNQTPMVLDGGACEVGIESTIVACLGSKPEILRAGMITAEQLETVGGVRVNSPGMAPNIVVPGQVSTHYAPRTRCQLLAGPQAVSSFLDAASSDLRVGYLGWQPAPSGVEKSVILEACPAASARQLYAGLRELDRAGLDVILVESPPSDQAWGGIRDRLQRACGP